MATPLLGHGNLYAAGVWLAAVSYALFNPEDPLFIGGRLSPVFLSRMRITSGEADMTRDPHLLVDLVLELEDGQWCRVVPVSGNPLTGIYRISLLSDLEPPPRPVFG